MFYERFIALCKENGEKPTPLVLSMGLSSSNVSQWKKGSTPRPEVLQALAEHFNVSVSYLLGAEKKPTTYSDELNEIIKLFESATPELQAAALAVLRSAEKEGGNIK